MRLDERKHWHSVFLGFGPKVIDPETGRARERVPEPPRETPERIARKRVEDVLAERRLRRELASFD